MVAIPVPKNDPDGVLYKRATIRHPSIPRPDLSGASQLEYGK
jgi:hypothetical protein